MSQIRSEPLAKREEFSGRTFQVWAYSVSHQSLLLRSTRENPHPTRVDVLFKGVARLSLPTTLTELAIQQADETTGDQDQPTTRWAIAGSGEHGFVDALSAFIHEDELEFHDASPLWNL